MCIKLYVCEFIYPHVLDSCVHTRCVSVMWLTVLYNVCSHMSRTAPYNIPTWFYILYTCVSEHACTAVQDVWEYKAQFHTHKCGYCRAPSEMCGNTHVYKIICVWIYIPTRLGQLCKHAWTHMYIIYKIMSVCCRAPSDTHGNTHAYKTVSHMTETHRVCTQPSKTHGNINLHKDDFIHMCLGIHTAVQDP